MSKTLTAFDLLLPFPIIPFPIIPSWHSIPNKLMTLTDAQPHSLLIHSSSFALSYLVLSCLILSSLTHGHSWRKNQGSGGRNCQEHCPLRQSNWWWKWGQGGKIRQSHHWEQEDPQSPPSATITSTRWVTVVAISAPSSSIWQQTSKIWNHAITLISFLLLVRVFL